MNPRERVGDHLAPCGLDPYACRSRATPARRDRRGSHLRRPADVLAERADLTPSRISQILRTTDAPKTSTSSVRRSSTSLTTPKNTSPQRRHPPRHLIDRATLSPTLTSSIYAPRPSDSPTRWTSDTDRRGLRRADGRHSCRELSIAHPWRHRRVNRPRSAIPPRTHRRM